MLRTSDRDRITARVLGMQRGRIAMRAAFDSLPPEHQTGILADPPDPQAEKALKTAYLRETALRNPHPNRATRRAALRKGRRA